MKDLVIAVVLVLPRVCFSNIREGEWSIWEGWGACSVTCGTGQQTRSRSCPSSGLVDDGCRGIDYGYQACTLSACQIDGGWSSWGSFEACSVTCGSGQQVRRRLCNSPAPANGGTSCQGEKYIYNSCTLSACPVNGGWSIWGSWATCSVTCGSGQLVRARVCNNPTPANGGVECTGEEHEYKSCTLSECPVDGAWSSWDSWGACTETCGSGQQTRRRFCNSPAPANGGASCPGVELIYQACTQSACTIDGAWSSWDSWGACTVSCGSGQQTRRRFCNSPAPANGGASCPGVELIYQACTQSACTIDGAWSSWDSWGACTVSCGSGQQTRRRFCNSPAPANGGASCPGVELIYQACTQSACTINGSWSIWGSWEACPVTCGSGQQIRTRVCNNPEAANGGAQCTGGKYEDISCSLSECPVDGSWSVWDSWGACLVTCGSGQQVRRRLCNSPVPANGGASCQGEESTNQACRLHACPIDGGWSVWDSLGACPVTCGPGQQVRRRFCNNPEPLNGGNQCTGGEHEDISCSLSECPEPKIQQSGNIPVVVGTVTGVLVIVILILILVVYAKRRWYNSKREPDYEITDISRDKPHIYEETQVNHTYQND